MKQIALLTSLFISVNILAQPFSMVKEINTTATSGAFGSSLIQQVGPIVYYVANDGISGNELWKSDGTNAGTAMVKEITPGSAGTGFSVMSQGNGLLFFVANDGVNGSELWRSDGTAAGTYLLKDIKAGNGSSDIIRLFFHNGTMYFGADDGINGSELWKSDGTTDGTILIKDINPGPTSGSPAPGSNAIYTFIGLGSNVYFSANDFSAVNGIGRELWKTDGTAAGTIPVKDIFSGGSAIGVTNHKTAIFNNKLYFSATSGLDGIELWATDGTEAGTYRVKDIVAGSGSSQPNNLIAFNGALYFTASSTNNAFPDLYKTDGTEGGTVLVRNLVADGISLTVGNSAAIDPFTVANGKLFFRGSGPSGTELYVTDGTTAGTGIVKDIYPGANGVNLNTLHEYNDNVYFLGLDVELPSRGGALYKSDGTAAGTVQITDGEHGGALGASSSVMTSAGGQLIFWGNTNDKGIELWRTDGTNANTALIKDINTTKIGTLNSGANAFGSLVHNGYYYYAAADDTHGNELWKSDGTTAGTVMVKDIWPGKAPSNPAQFFLYNGAIYFTASNGLSGTELWKTDGTDAGTVLVSDINPGPVNSGPNRFFIINNYLYFTAYHTLYGTELWRSDGTASGTTMVIDLVVGAGTGTGNILDVISIGNNAYAIMNLAAGNVLGIPPGNRLVKIDGVSNTISDFAAVVTQGIDLGVIGNTLYITGRNATNQTLLWKSENEGAVTQVKILSTTITNAYQLTNCGGKIYFIASNGAVSGLEPWISDGTEAGTYMLKDINPGANSSTPYQFIFSGDKVYFTASSTGNLNGEYELWATDGTNAGTYLVKDIYPGPTGSRPNAAIPAFGNKVLFTANNGTNGYELWQSDGTSVGTFQLQEFNLNGDGIPLTGVPVNFATDYVYSKMGDNILFFARSADKGLQLYSGSIASPYKYVNDNSTANDVFTTAVGNDGNNGSQSAPYATLTHALSQASEGDTIYVDAGTFIEQVTITKGITIIGAGQNLTTVTNDPAIALLQPPGNFTEIGLIQTGQNIGDVHISKMKIFPHLSSTPFIPHPILIQGGGSVKACTIMNGGQGIFFRVQYSTKTALIENNTITAEYIGVNCEGTGLTTKLLNNTIIVTNSGFSTGAFIGADGEGFSPVYQFVAIGNSLNTYRTTGFQVNSSNTTITQNSFLGTGNLAIQQTGGNQIIATCNWYNTTIAATITAKHSGNIIYSPWLTSGNDNSGDPGFQPANGTCSGNSIYYVNDNSRTGDVFTTAVGSNSNNGSASAPFATLSYALTQAANKDIIYVDAGTFAEQVIITKGITINGAGRDLTSFIKPATALVPAPGVFSEIGLFETSLLTDEVHISHLTVNSVDGTSQNIIIQAGGSVKYCKLLNGGQGVFFRYEPVPNPDVRGAVIENNIIEPAYIGINCQGSKLNTFILNNVITKATPYSAGVFAGLDFGPLPALYIFNNTFNNYSDVGLNANSVSGFYINNSLTGTNGSIAIQKYSGNTPNATCNWFGSADQNLVVPQIQGAVTYSPWLTNGTDNNTAFGFQPLPGVCTGRQNKFYVNDNNLTGDVFSVGTNPVGNDNNGGVPSAPLATIGVALSRAQAGDSIFVDAGSYPMSNFTIDKGVTIIGTNYQHSPNNPVDKKQINPVRNTESIISGATVTLGSSSISLQGLMFDPGLKTAISLDNSVGSNNTHGNFSLLKNRFRVVQPSSQVILVGVGVAATSPAPVSVGGLINSGFNITDNRFEKSATGGGAIFSVHLVKNVTIDNNSFVVGVGGAVRSATALSFGFVGVVDDVDITNNTIDQFATGITGNHLANAVITGNNIYNTNTAFNISNTMPESSAIEFSDNLLDGSSGITPFVFYTRGGGGGAGASSLFKAENNTITGVAIPGTTSVLGTFNATFTNSVLNPSLFIRRNKMNFSGDLSTVPGQFIRPIIIRGKLTNATVENNELTLTGTNLQPRTNVNVLPVCPAISLYSDNGFGSVIPAGAVINILNNKIHGFKHSFVVFDPIASPTGDSYTGFGNLGPNIAVNVHENSFTGDSMSINNGSVGHPIDASCNWYGSASIQNLVGKFSTDLDNNYLPYLTNGTDNDPATGFQPIPGSCNGQPIQARLDGYTNVTCHGANNGSASITVFNGVAPFVFAWTKDGDPLFSSTIEDPTNFGPGTYHLTITDALGTNVILDENGDFRTIDVTITEPSVLTASANGSNVNCFNGTNGTASVLADGGTPLYSYLWSNGATTSTISNLTAGTYTVTITDANGCTVQTSYEVTQPILLTAVATGTSTSCANSATVTVSGGTVPYSFSWSNGAITQSITSIPAGTYTVTVTDGKGCTASSTVTVTANQAFNPSASVTDVLCFGTATGSITITNVNGVSPFQFSLDGVNFSSPAPLPYTFTGLAAGSYTITVKDANGCTGFVTKTVTEPPLLVVAQGSVQSTCSAQSTGSITVIVTGGSGTLSYSWTGPGGYTSTQRNISGLSTGNYSLTVTDANGCLKTLNVTVPVYPAINVTASITNVLCFGGSTGSIDITVSGGTGSGFSYLWNNLATTQDRFNLAAGNNYRITVTDIGSGCPVSRRDTVLQPSSGVSVTVSNQSIVDVSGCTSLGSFTAQGSGGTQYPNPDPYRYSINGVDYQTSRTFSNLAAGNYTVTVKDANGCIATRPVFIDDNGADEYESLPNNPGNNTNNTRGKAAPISLGGIILARIGTAGDVDYYKLSPANTWSGSYTLSFGQPATAVNIYLVASNGNTIIPAADSSATHKQYNVTAGTYFVRVSGNLSANCYQFTITTGAAARPGETLYTENNKKLQPVPPVLKVVAYPNPHEGDFTLQIESPEDGLATVILFTVSGQKMTERKIALRKGSNNTVSFTGIHAGTIFYQVQFGKKTVNGKVIGIE